MTASRNALVLVALLGAATAVAVLPRATRAAFPGANGRICFTSNRDARTGDIYTIEPDGSGLRRVTTDPSNDAQCAFSPDGTRIAFRREVAGGYQEVFVMDAGGGSERRLTFTDDQTFDSQPAWSPDGRKLLFRSNRASSGSRDGDIWIMNADGSNQRLVEALDGDERYPAFSPSGRRIAFRSNPEGDAEVYTMNARGRNVVRLTSNDTVDTAPAWTPDGRRIAFESFRHDPRAPKNRIPTSQEERELKAELYLVNADGTGERRLTENDFHDEGQAPSPDGTMVAFTSLRHASPDGRLSSEIYLMRPDGADQRPLSPDPAKEESPDWGPAAVGPAPPLGRRRGPRDTDHDGIPDRRERRTNPRLWDTDGDGLSDGREDRNRNGRRDRRETDPTRRDTDGDRLSDARDPYPLDRRRH